jgi:hypothetical protein
MLSTVVELLRLPVTKITQIYELHAVFRREHEAGGRR